MHLACGVWTACWAINAVMKTDCRTAVCPWKQHWIILFCLELFYNSANHRCTYIQHHKTQFCESQKVPYIQHHKTQFCESQKYHTSNITKHNSASHRSTIHPTSQNTILRATEVPYIQHHRTQFCKPQKVPYIQHHKTQFCNLTFRGLCIVSIFVLIY